jgi:hypothetical protein
LKRCSDENRTLQWKVFTVLARNLPRKPKVRFGGTYLATRRGVLVELELKEAGIDQSGWMWSGLKCPIARSSSFLAGDWLGRLIAMQ